MENVENRLSTNERITTEMMNNEDFCLSIVSCNDREEVKKFLASKGIVTDDNDIDNLAENISEIAAICKKLDDEDLDDVVGGDWTPDDWKNFGEKSSKGLGIGAMVIGGLLILTFVASGIKKLGDEKGWWNKSGSKK